ncbi:MAG: hypothetical protein HRF50_14520 [Phycisphaerae bacterium]|jgi:hypothetical protein
MRRIERKRSSSQSAAVRMGWLQRRGFWLALGWVGLLGAAAFGLGKLEPYVRRTNTQPTRIEWRGLPPWIAKASWEHVVRSIEEQVNLDERTDIFDPRVCQYVAEAVARSPWIKSVRRTAKQSDGRVTVEAEFRRPLTFVECADRAYLIDDEGVRLPPELPAEFISRDDWIPIRGVASAPPPPGQAWNGEDLAAAIKLVKFLYGAHDVSPLPFRGALRAVDASNYNYRQRPSDGWLKLITTNPRSYIHWGLPPGEEYGIESTAAMKLAALSKLCRERGGLPVAGPIDIRPDDRILIGEPQ